MKYLIILLAAGLISITFSVDANAQIMNRLKKKAQKAAAAKAEQKVTERVERAAEQMVERSWNSVFGQMPEDTTSGRVFPFMRSSNVTTNDAYTFDTITTMEIETINENGETEPPVIMHMHFPKNEMYTGTQFESEETKKEENDLFIIYDAGNLAMLMLMQSDGDNFSFAYNWDQSQEEYENVEEEEEEMDWNEIEEWQGYTKIGTKEILGYECDGYRSETETENVEIWVSRDADFGMNNMFRANSNAKHLRGKVPENFPQGMVMEMYMEDLGNGDKTTLKVTDIKHNARITYLMADYPTMSMAEK